MEPIKGDDLARALESFAAAAQSACAAFDHFPLMTVPPIAQPFVPAAPAPPAPQRFVKFGDSMVCLTCNLDARYCRGHTPSPSPSPPTGDGIDSDLNRRIRELRGRDSR